MIETEGVFAGVTSDVDIKKNIARFSATRRITPMVILCPGLCPGLPNGSSHGR